ncbi:hypothetical protein MFLAVUS_011522, partial [Mucor flavus]
SDGVVTSVPIGSIGQQTGSSKLPTADLGNGNTVSDYKGPGTYTVSPGNVVSVGSAGDYSFISGTGANGVNAGSTSLPTAQLPTSTPFDPLSGNTTPGFSLSTRSDGIVTSVPIGSIGQQTGSSKLPTADLGNGNTVSDYKGPGTYTVSPGNVVSVGSAGDYSFISGTGANGVNAGSTSLPTAQLPTSTPFDPLSGNTTPGFSLSTGSDGIVTSVPIGSIGQQTGSSKLPTADLGNGNTVSDYKGPGTYTVSPGNVVSVGSAGDYSFISGTGANGVNAGSTSLPTAQLPTSTPFDPLSGNTTPGFSLSTGSDGVVTSVPIGSIGQQTGSSKLPTADLGNGNTISDYKGPGTYTVSPGNVVSVGSAGDYSFISGTGANGVNAGSTSLPTAQLPTSTPFDPLSGNTTPGFSLSTGSDGVVTSVPIGSIGQQTGSSKLPTADLGNGNTISDYKGPGTYTVSPGNVVSVGSAGDYSFISGTGANGVNAGSTSLPTATSFNPLSGNTTPGFSLSTGSDGVVTSVPTGSIGQQTGSSKLPTADLGNGNTVSDYKGPGTYTVSPGNVVSVGSAGDYSFISGTGANGVNAGSTSLPTAQLPTSTPFDPLSGNTTPGFSLSTGSDGVVTSVPIGSIGQQTGSSKLPTADLGNGNTVSDYKGPGTYTVSPGNVVSVGSAGDYSFISGTGANGVNAGSTSLPTATSFNPLSGNTTPGFSLSTRSDGIVTSVPIGSIGQQTGSSKLPTADLGNGNTVSDYKGPGTYTVSPGNVVSVGSAGDYSFISGTGANGVNAGSTSLPTATSFNPLSGNTTPGFSLSTGSDGVVTSVPTGSIGQQTGSSKLPTADLGNGNTVSDYKGPGTYTVSPGNVVSVGSAGDYSFISGTGANGVNAGSTSLPTAQLPTSTPFDPLSGNTTPGFSLSTGSDGIVTSVPIGSIGQQTGSSKLPTADLGNGNTVSDYKGPGTYTVSPGNVVSVGSAGDYSFISGTGANGVNAGSTSLPTAQLPTSTPFDPLSGNTTPGFSLSTRSDGIVTSVPIGSIGQQTGSSKLPTADLGNGNTVSDYKGPGTYTVSPGNVVSVGSAGDYSFISGTGANGVNAGSTSLPTATSFNPLSGNTTPGFSLSTGSDGVVTSVPIGSIGQQTGSSKLPTADLGNGNTISDYKGPGTYTVSPGNVVSVGSAGDYSFISGTGANGVNAGSTSLPTATSFNPLSGNTTPGFSLSTGSDGAVTSVPTGSIGQQTGSSKLPTADLGNGNTVSDYKGPGTYTVSPGNVVSVGSAGDYSFISGTGANGVNAGSTSLPTATSFNPLSGNTTPGFSLSTGSDGIVTSVPIGSIGQQTGSSKLPTADLGNGNTVSDYKGPGTYTVSPGNVVSVGSAGDYSFISGTGANGVNAGSTSLPTSTPFDPLSGNTTPGFSLSTGSDGVVTSVPIGSIGQQTGSSKLPTADLGNGNTVSDYKGPGTYTVSPGNVVSVGSAGDYSFISGTGANGVNAGSTSLPTATSFNPLSGNTTPGFSLSTGSDGIVTSVPIGSIGQQTGSSKLPTADLGNGNTVSDYKGPGTYTVSPGNVVSVGSAGDYSFISGTGANGVNAGSTSLPTATSFNPLSGNTTPGFSLSTGSDGAVTSVPTGSIGQQTGSSKLPTADLGNGNTVSDYKGPGTYTVSPGNVVSVGSAGDYSFISGTGANGVNAGSTSLPTATSFNPLSGNTTPGFSLSTGSDGVVTSVPIGSIGQQTGSSKLPTADLGNGNTVSDYKGPGTYTVSPGNVVSVGSAGDYSFISGTGANGVNAGSTSLPTATSFNPLSGNTTPGFSLSTGSDGIVTSVPIGSIGQQTGSSKLPTADLGNGNTVSDYKGPGTYTVSPGNVVSVGSAGDYSFISGTGANGVNAGSTSLPTAQLPTSTPFDPLSGNTTPGFSLSTGSDGVVTSVPIGSIGQQTGSSKLPTADLGNGNTVSDYKGPGTYTVSPGNVVSVGSAGDYSFISGTGANGVNAGSTSLPTATSFNPLSGNTTPGFSLSTGSDGIVTSVPIGSIGQQTGSSKLPTADLGNGNTVSDYKGPGTYTVSPGNVVSVGSAGDYSFISGTGANGVNAGSTSLPTAQLPTSTPFDPLSGNTTPGFSLSTGSDGVVTSVPTGSIGQQTGSSKLPTADLGNGNTISDYKGPGTYTVSPGNVVSVGSAGDYSFISGTGANGVNAGSTSLPTAQLPTSTPFDPLSGNTTPGFSLSTRSDGIVTSVPIGSIGQQTGSSKLPTADLGNGNTVSDYKGPGTYTVSPGNVVSVGSAGDYSFISGTGANGVNAGSTSLPTATSFNPLSGNTTPGFSLSTGSDGIVTSVPIGSIGQQTGSSKLPTADLGNGNTVSDYKGPGTYTVSPGNVVSVGSAGDYSFISGTGANGVNAGSTSLPTAQLPTSTPFDPLSGNTTPGFSLSTGSDGIVTSVPIGSIGQQTGSSKLPTADLGNGNTVSDYKGPGTYTVSPGNVVSVGSAGDYSFISGTGANGVNAGSTSLPTAQLPTSTPFDPLSGNTTPGFSLSTGSDGIVTSVPIGSIGQQTGSSKLPTADLGNGNTVSDYKGPGTYTVSPGNVVSVGSAGDYSFISGTGANGVNAGSTSLPSSSLRTISFGDGDVITAFTGPGTYTDSGGHVVSVGSDNGITPIQTGSTRNPTNVNSNLPTVTLGDGDVITGYTGPGTYKDSGGHAISVGSDNLVTPIETGSTRNPTNVNSNLPTVTLGDGDVITGYTGPGTYKDSGGHAISVGSDNLVTPIETGSTRNPTNVNSNLPTVTLGDGDVITGYTGPGTYKDSGGHAISVGSDNLVTPIETGSTRNPTNVNSNLPTVTLGDGDVITGYTGPGTYKDSGGHAISVGSDNLVTPIETGSAGQVTPSNGNLPTTKLPMADLGNGNTISDYKGPGTYTVSPGNVVSVGSAGDYSFISGTGANGVNAGSTSLPTATSFNPLSGNTTPGFSLSTRPDGIVTSVPIGSIGQQTGSSKLPTADLGNGNTISDYKGPGTYTVSPGNVVSVGSAGDYSFISGTGANGVNAGSTSLPYSSLRTISLSDGDVITAFTGPGTYTDSGGHVVSVGSDNGITPVQIGSSSTMVQITPQSNTSGQVFPGITLPNVNLQTLSLGGGVNIDHYKGPGVYTISSGNVVSVDASGSYSFISGSGANGSKQGTLDLPNLSLPTVSLAGGISLAGFTGPGLYTYSPGNVVSIDSNGSINWLQGGPKTVSGGGFSFPTPVLPSITLPNLNLPSLNLNFGNNILNYHGPGIYTISPGNVVSIDGDGSYSYVLGSGSFGVKSGSISLPTYSLPGITLQNGISVPKYSGPGIYTISPGNVLSIGSDGGYKWLQGGPQTLSGGGITLPSYDLSASMPSPSGTYINGVNFKFPFDIPSFNGPGFYTLSPGNVVQVHADGSYVFISGGPPNGKISYPSVTLPNINFPTLNLGGGITLGSYKGPGVYTVSPGNVVSIYPGGSISYISGSGANGNQGGSITLPNLSLPTLSLAGGISLDAFTGPGVYTYSPGNVVSIGANGGIDWLVGGPQSVSGSFTFPNPNVPSITLPTLNLPNADFGVGSQIHDYHGPGIYTISPGNVISVDAGGSYTYLMGSGFLGLRTGIMSLPTYSLPGITLQNGISVPKYSGPGIYTVSPGNVLSIGADGGYKWLQGGPQTLDGGGITLPSYDLSGSPPIPLQTYIGGVQFKFPFDVPSFNGPGFYTLSPGNVVRVRADGSYVFISGGPPNPSGAKITYPSVSLPNVHYSTLNLGSGLTVSQYTGPGVYTLGSGNVVSIAPGGSFSFISGSGANGNVNLPDLSLPTLSLAGGISLDAFTGPGVYTYSPGNVVSIGANGGVDWLAGGPQSVSGGGFTFPTPNIPSITLPTVTLPNANFGIGYNIRNFHGPGIYTISPGNVLSVAADGSYTYLMGNGFLGAKTGTMSLPTYSLPSITLDGGISVPKYSGPGIYTVSPGNVLSIGADGGYKWLQGGPQTLDGGGITLPSYDLSGSPPIPLQTYIGGVQFKFPFDVPSFTGPGFYTLSPGNIVQVRADGSYVFISGGPPNGKISYPSVTLPNINFPTLNLGGGITLGSYKGPGVYTVSPGNVVSIYPGGSISYISGSGANGNQGGSITLPNLSLPTLSLAGGISLDAFTGPGVYTYSPGNVVSIGANGGVDWLAGGPQSVSGGGFTFPTLSIPSITLPTVTLPNANFGIGYNIRNFHGPGIYTISAGNVLSVAADGSYTYLMGNGFLGAKTGTMSLPTYSLPGITLQNGISVPKYSGPGIYTISPGNVLSIGADGGYKWLQGGPQTLDGGGITLPSYDLSGSPPIPLQTYIGGVQFKFPFDIPSFNGPGFYTLSPGNVVQVHADGSYVFISGGPPNGKISYPSVTLPNINFPTLNLGGGITLGSYKGPGVYTVSPGNVVSIYPGGSISYISGSGANGNQGGSITLPNLSLPTLSLAGGISLDAFTGPGVYTYSPGNVVSIGANG